MSRSLVTRLAGLLLTGSVGVLAGCPGGPESTIDADGDGYTDQFDCNDSDAAIGMAIAFYLDADKDGYGDPQFSASGCLQPDGFVANPGDCDDLSAAFNPAAEETECGDATDYNCDGKVAFIDDDKDGWAACEDCDDKDADLNPDTPWYRDRDEDGYGNPDAVIHDCNPPTGYVRDNTDCNDFNRDIHEEQKYFADNDEDQYGDPDNWVLDCRTPAGHVPNDDDCDDSDAETNPKREWFEDADDDGYGNAESIARACLQPAGYVANQDDCDDQAKGTAPDKIELCDGKDNDCDSVIDDGAPTEAWYGDDDGDTWGATAYMVESCTPVPGYVRRDGDCADTDPTINPNAIDDLCDGIDRGCDFEAGLVTWTPQGGSATDVSAQFATGTIDAPYVWTAPDHGELLLCGGSYAAELRITGKTVDITGVYGDGATTVSAALDDHALEYVSAEGQVNGVTFRDGFGSDGGAVYLEDSIVSLGGCSVLESLADDGGGIWLDVDTTLTLTNTIVEGNVAANNGGGVWIGGDLISDGGAIQGNDADRGGAAFVIGTWDATSTTVNANTAVATNAAIHIEPSGLVSFLTCDLAPSTSPIDNDPHDVYGETSKAVVDLGDDVTRICDASSCL